MAMLKSLCLVAENDLSCESFSKTVHFAVGPFQTSIQGTEDRLGTGPIVPWTAPFIW